MDVTTLKNLAISDTGFIFDPFSGKTFTVNEVGMVIIQSLKNGEDVGLIQNKIMEEFDTTLDQLERDISDFLIQLKEQSLIQ
jgi:hypothetical protein